jgi:hypothetical protein
MLEKHGILGVLTSNLKKGFFGLTNFVLFLVTCGIL